jgi:prepilin-type N-terminal cleavage/methylation domain-containing protein
MRLKQTKGFTLIELLTVMAVIVVLSGLILSVISYVNKKAGRTRAVNEIGAIAAALENYKADNGVYPNDADVSSGYSKGNTDNLDARTQGDPATYTKAGLVLYRALSGDRNLDRVVDNTDQSLSISGGSQSPALDSLPTVYYNFTPGMLSPSGGTGTVTALLDPFGNSYGYSTAYQGDIASGITPPTHGINPTFDLWSTTATASKTTDTPTQIQQKQQQWISNFQSSGQ